MIVSIGAGLAVFTDRTEYSADEVRRWSGVAAQALGGLGAILAASIAIVAIRAQERSSHFAVASQERAGQAAVAAQLATSEQALTQQRSIALDLAQFEQQRLDREALRLVSARFTATLAQIDLHASAVKDSQRREDALRRLPDLQVAARAEYESLRLLASGETQRAGRMALRHAWAMWKLAETGVDPRGAEFKEDPWTRYHRELRSLLVSVRTDLGLEQPEDVFEEPDS